MSDNLLVSVSEDPSEPGEVVFRLHGALGEYLHEHGRSGRDKVLLGLAHLIGEVRRRLDEAGEGTTIGGLDV